MVFRLKAKLLGGHVHVAVFQAKELNQTFAKNGDLVFDLEGWWEFKDLCRFGPAIADQAVVEEEGE